MHTFLPNLRAVAVPLNPKSTNAWPDLKETDAATRALGLELKIFEASTEQEIDTASARIAKERAAAGSSLPTALPSEPVRQFVALAARHAVPASYPWPEFADIGGLIGYGATAPTPGGRQELMWAESKGEKPSDLPVMQASKVELVINRKTAQALGLEIPTSAGTR